MTRKQIDALTTVIRLAKYGRHKEGLKTAEQTLTEGQAILAVEAIVESARATRCGRCQGEGQFCDRCGRGTRRCRCFVPCHVQCAHESA